jgi:uncharacterized protein YrzB (UPF0473 family)
MSRSKKKKKSNNAPQIQEVELITLTDDEGNEVDFEYLDTIEYKDRFYCVLYPNVDSDDEDFIIFEIVEKPDEDFATYQQVDDVTLQKVFNIFKSQQPNE